MTATVPSRVLTVRIETPFDTAYARLCDPMTWPDWASGMGDGLSRRADGDYAIRSVDGGQSTVRFTPPNPHGILDHAVFLEGGGTVAVPMRLVRNGDGCEVQFTLLRQPGMTDDQFEHDAQWVEKDLARLKAVLEG